MKTAQEYCNDLYKDLCAQMKDLELQRAELDKALASLEERIKALNTHVPSFLNFERMIKDQIRKDQETVSRPPQKIENITNLVDEEK